MSAAPRFSLRAAVTDNVSRGRIDESSLVSEPEPTGQAAAPRAPASTPDITRTKRPTTRQGARGITVWVEPEIYRMVKLVGLDADMTTQDIMMEAIRDLLMKRGKGDLFGSHRK
ncbi:ribbon-helix-helix domain-containing protein [Methylobacterium sp. E-041]|uniref:ribbon-helix-helix domain-containing protein n=1 Tax=Methylobacterium sp. E-041 TaxID=2836573 RepID=UPI00391D3428